MYTAIAIVFAVSAAAATPVTARQVRAGAVAGGAAAATGVEVGSPCGDKLAGNSDWAALVLGQEPQWPFYAYASRDYPYYDHGYCDYGNLGQSYGYAPGAGRHRAKLK